MPYMPVHTPPGVPNLPIGQPTGGPQAPQAGPYTPQGGSAGGQNMPPSGPYGPQSGPNVPPGGPYRPQNGPNVSSGGPYGPQSGPNVPPGGQAPGAVGQGSGPHAPQTLAFAPATEPSIRKSRPAWLLPSLAALVVVLIAATGVGAFYLSGSDSPVNPSPTAGGGTEAAGKSAVGAAAKGPDVCGMLPKEEVDRLVPEATISKSSRAGDISIDFTCNWINRRISFGEFRRDREIDVRISQFKGDGSKTGRSVAQNMFEVEYGSAEYGATATPSPTAGEKNYQSAITDIQGVGDGAFAQYTWHRDKMLWYAFGTAHARVGDMMIKVRFQAGQQRKDAQILSSDTVQAITEENAIREVSKLVAYFAKGVAGWQKSNPGVLAKPEASSDVTISPTPRATPTPTELAAFPAECAAMSETAVRLVPKATTRARGTVVGSDNQLECRWLNRELSGGPGVTKIRSALITVHRFTNRAGEADEAGARAYYASELGGSKSTANTSLGGIVFGKLTELDTFGDQAHRLFTQIRQGETFASSGTVVMREGSLVIQVDYSGHQRPEGAQPNSREVKFMSEKEALEGANTLASAYLRVLRDQPAGS